MSNILQQAAAMTKLQHINGKAPTDAEQLAMAREALAKNKAMEDELAKLKAENEALRAKRARSLTLKVSEKGAVSLYGLGRFPVTLYKTQWEKLLDLADTIKDFIRANEDKLTIKE